jgi:hypothetical protein
MQPKSAAAKLVRARRCVLLWEEWRKKGEKSAAGLRLVRGGEKQARTIMPIEEKA